MKISQAIKMALSSVFSNKMRSFLTMLGIIIGVMAVTLLISIVQGATSGITDELSSLGGANLTCSVYSSSPKLELSDIEELTKEECISNVCAYLNTNGTATAVGNSEDVSIVGITQDYQEMNGIIIESGRPITTNDNDYRLNVCVIGAGVAKNIFGNTDVLDETIRLKGKDYKIVGIIEEAGENAMNTVDLNVYIPFSNAQRLVGGSGVRIFDVAAASNDDTTIAENKVNDFLGDRYDEDEFDVFNMGRLVDMVQNIYSALSYLLGGIASISLLVGGIGIMNIMLVSVTERTKEIGIRKAIGAEKSDIIIQFLIESIVLSLMGGIIGMIISGGILAIINVFVTDYHFSITFFVAFIAVAFSVAVGIIFGIYPANKAAKLKPIDALRFE